MKVFLVGLLMLASFCTGYSADNVNYGILNYNSETLEYINANGVVNVKNSTVKGTVHIKGALNATNSTLGALKIQGGANLTNCTITQTTYIDGILRAEKTTFNGEISIATERFTLNECSTHSIRIRKALGLGKQVLELNHTTVNGDITFDIKDGEVWLSPGSTVSGKIIGGTLVNK